MDGQPDDKTMLARLRDSDTSAARIHAAELEELYHARQMAELSSDVYDAARGEGQPPHGWARATEDIELLRSLIPDAELSDEQLRAMFRPDESGFRAEIYVPDPEVLGPGYRPTLVFKGSAGEVLGPGGALRPTAAEDFLGNNFPQSMGLQTDYYDRAMDLAVLLKEAGLDFDVTGHSLGGGLASAAAAVSGMRAVTWNAAGLHPDTVARFARENGNLPVYDTSSTVTAWQVRGDVLNDGVQGDLANLGSADRRRLAGILSNTAMLVREVPQAREHLEHLLTTGIPESSHPAIHAFVDRLARGNAADLLEHMPQAAGQRREPLVAMTAEGHALVPREDAASVADLHRLAAPMLTVLVTTAHSARIGHGAGELVDAGGAAVRGGLDWTGVRASQAWTQAGNFAGQGYEVVGVAIDHGLRTGGELAAQWRELRADAEASVRRAGGALEANANARGADVARGISWVASRLPWELGRNAQTHASQAAEMLDGRAVQAQARAEDDAANSLARGRAAAAVYRIVAAAAGSELADDLSRQGATVRLALHGVGNAVEDGFRDTGRRLDEVTSRAPAAGATVGATTGVLVGTVGSHFPHLGDGGRGVRSTVHLVREAAPALHEAVERHGMATAVIPSLDAEIARREQAARAFLDARSQAPEARTQAPPAPLTQPPAHPALRGESGRAMAQYFEALRSADPARISATASALLETPAARQWIEQGRAQLEQAQAQAAAGHAASREQASGAQMAPGL